MTRSILIAVLFVTLIVGCASSGEVAVATGQLEDLGLSLELVETHRDGTVELELSVFEEGETRVHQTYEWPEQGVPPDALLADLAALDPGLIEDASDDETSPFRSTCAPDVGFPDGDPVCVEVPGSEDEPRLAVVWPELIEAATRFRLEARTSLRPAAEGCADNVGFSDCVRAAR